MRNDSHRPEDNKGTKPPKPSGTSGALTDADLWDLDSIAPEKAGTRNTDPLPPRRTVSSAAPTAGGGERTATPPAAEATPAPRMERTSEAARHDSGDDGDPVEEAGKSTAGPLLSGSLTTIEKIAITALFAALVIGAAFAIIHFSNRVPTRPLLPDEIAYPVRGDLVEVQSAVTYWRKPVTSGDEADVVRRGTVLIPVVKLSLNSKRGAIRVFFRDGEGTVIGDGISRDVNGKQEVVVAATAGFEDIGMHAAYRTGGTEPWTVKVFEGPDSGADRSNFKEILDTRISSDRR